MLKQIILLIFGYTASFLKTVLAYFLKLEFKIRWLDIKRRDWDENQN